MSILAQKIQWRFVFGRKLKAPETLTKEEMQEHLGVFECAECIDAVRFDYCKSHMLYMVKGHTGRNCQIFNTTAEEHAKCKKLLDKPKKGLRLLRLFKKER